MLVIGYLRGERMPGGLRPGESQMRDLELAIRENGVAQLPIQRDSVWDINWIKSELSRKLGYQVVERTTPTQIHLKPRI
jgi:hypothetical protein